MKDLEEQITLINENRKRWGQCYARDDFRRHLRFIGRFLRRNKTLAISAGLLIFSQGAIEVLLIFVSKNRLLSSSATATGDFFWWFVALAALTFILSSFFSIKQEKTLVVLLINDLRRKIFKSYLNKPLDHMNTEGKAGLIAKISYHLPLVSMGVSSSFFGIVRWFMYFPIILVISYFLEINAWLAAAVFIGLSIVIAGSTYFLVRHYVSKEVTFYSQIIRHIDTSLTEKHFFKNFRLEKTALKKLDDLVALDSVFRVRRDLWFKMGFKVMFIIFLLGAMLGQIFYGNILSQINLISPNLKFLYLLLAIYFSRLAYESLQIGLYFFPAKLGLALTNIRTGKTSRSEDRLRIKSSLVLYSQKTKLFQEGKYYNKASWEFNVSGRYLIKGPACSGKTALAKILAGRGTYNLKALKFRLDGERLDYQGYCQLFSNFYFFDPGFYSEKNLLELMAGASRDDISSELVSTVMETAAAHPLLSKLISSSSNFGSSAKGLWAKPSSAFALHALTCLVKKPDLVIIDNFWTDLDYPEIKEAIKILDKHLPDSIIVLFSRSDSNLLNYQKIYDLD